MTGKIKRRSLRCGGRPKADFGSLFTSVIAPAFNAAGSIADESIDNNKTITNGIVNNNTTIPSDPTKTPTMRLGGRKKCWIGAAIGAATSIAGSLFGNRAQKREMRRQQSIRDWQDTTQEAANMTSVLNNSRDYQEDYLRQFRTAARLGKTLGAKGIYITDGGNATKIGNNTYLLRGGSHEDVNETGQTGIGINVGGNEIEAEGGEVAQKKNGALRIFSAQPILSNGMSPAQAILRGYNKDSVFSQQQAFKKRNGLKDDGSKAAFGNLITMPFAGIVKDVVDYFSNNGKYATKRVKVSNKTVNRKPIRNGQVGNFRVVNGKYFPNEKPLRQVYPEFDIISMGRGLPIKRSLKNTVGFVQKPNTFTRGIGNREGIKDLVESKVVRGNPVGTEMTAKAYTKATKFNRDKFNDIMNGTGIEGISHRYYNRSLSKEDFDAIRESYNKINASFKARHPKASGKIRFAIGDDVYDPLGNYKNYDDYLAQIASDRKTLRNATTINPDNGEPIAYFYDDGRNPLTQGHGYASSKWGVRISNPQDYNMKIFDGHLHYSNSKTIPFDSPNVEVFRSTPFGTIRYPKWMLRRGWYRNGGLTSKDRGSSKRPYPSVSSKDFAGGGRSYPIPTKADAVDALRLAGLHGRSDVRSKVYSKYPSLRPKAAFGDWVRTNRDDNALADLLYESGLFDRESWNTMLRDIHEFTGMGANPYNTDDNIDAAMAPAFGVPNQAQIIRNIQQANKLMQAAKASQAAQRTAYAAKEAKDFYRGLGINIPVGRNQIYNPTFRSSEIASKIKDSNDALRIYLNNTHLPKGIRLTPVNQDNISRSAARVINPREAEIVRMGISIGQSAKNMTNGANPFLYTSRNSNEVLEGLNRVIASAKQGAKNVGQRVRNNRAVREFRNLSNKDKAKYIGMAGFAATALPAVSIYLGNKLVGKDNKSTPVQKDAHGKPISQYIARPQVSTQQPSRPQAKKATPTQKSVVVPKQGNKTVPQYKGNTTKGNYQLHDGETKTINDIKYTRRGNAIINHKTNVAYIYDKNGNYTGKADYSKVGNFNQAFDAARAAGRSQFIYRAGKYNNYSTIKETNAKKEILNRIVGARRVAKALGGYSRPVKGMRPKAATGIYVPFNKRYTSIYDAPDYNSDYNGGNVLGDGEVTITAKRIKPTFMKPNNDAMNLIKVPKEEVPYIPQRHNRSRTIFSGGDYLGLGIDTLAALSTGIVNYNTAGKYTLPDRAPIIQASKLPTTYNVNPEIEEVKRYRDRLTGQTFNNTSSSVAALNRSSAINLDALSNLSKLWATKENEENKMLTEDAKNQQTVAAQNVQNELARQSEIARIKNEAIQAKGDALNVGLSGLSQAWTNFWTAGRTAYEDDQARRAMVASSKDATPTRLIEMGYDLSPDIVASLYGTAKDDRTKRFYLSRLSSAQRQKYGIN